MLACTASLASCAIVTRDQGDPARISGFERTLELDFATAAAFSPAVSAHQLSRYPRLDGDEGHGDEHDLMLSFNESGFFDVVLFHDDFIEPASLEKGVMHPFKCRITPIATSARHRQWRIFPCESGLSLLVVEGVGESAAPISLLVSGYEPQQKYLSDYQGLPKVHVLEILNGEIAEQVESAVRSARSRWDYMDVFLILLIPGSLLVGSLAFMLMVRPRLRHGQTSL